MKRKILILRLECGIKWNSNCRKKEWNQFKSEENTVRIFNYWGKIWGLRLIF